jgi:hypothetical protein
VIRTLLIALVALAIVFWLGFAYWVNKDARRRSRNLAFVGFSTLLGLVPCVGPLVYLLVRPAETRHDIRARDAEVAAFETLAARRGATCPECTAPVEPDYLVCPVCTTHLREPCVRCNAPLEPLWQMCPYCATSVDAVPDLDVALTREVRAALTLDLVTEPAAQAADI